MGHHVGFRYFIAWSSPYQDPPDGKPRILIEMFETNNQREERYRRGDHNPTPIEFASRHILGDGYSINIQPVCMPSKQLSKETLAIVRKKRLEKRLSKKYPLFSTEFVKEELAKNPEYYQGITRKDLQEGHDAAINYEKELYQKFLDMTGDTKNEKRQ